MISINHIKHTIDKKIDRHRNMVIIGEAETSNKINEIHYCNSENEVLNIYGNCDLVDCYNEAKKIGVKDIYIINMKRKIDYLLLIDVLIQYDFTYIAPINIKFSDTFYDIEKKKNIHYIDFLLEELSKTTNSTIIVTDHHANLYDNMDLFLYEMKNSIIKFKSNAYISLEHGNNLLFCANNLIDYKYSNVVIASILCIQNYNSYPDYDFGDAVFDIDSEDVEDYELIYFKNNYLTNTSIENFVNFSKKYDAGKLVLADRVSKYIKRELDFSIYEGKSFNEYIRFLIIKHLKDFLNSIMDFAIIGYSINSVQFKEDKNTMTEIIILDFSIRPFCSIDNFNILLET